MIDDSTVCSEFLFCFIYSIYLFLCEVGVHLEEDTSPGSVRHVQAFMIISTNQMRLHGFSGLVIVPRNLQEINTISSINMFYATDKRSSIQQSTYEDVRIYRILYKGPSGPI